MSALLAVEDDTANLVETEAEVEKEKPLVPGRERLETGHRIPLHLFPLHTQNRILEVEPASPRPAPAYTDTASFRQPAPAPATTKPPALATTKPPAPALTAAERARAIQETLR